jgi:Uma2 family endonuclease
MSIATAPTQTPTQAQSLPETWARRRWTGEEFDRLMEQGFIREGSSTFLWDGEIIEPMAEDQPHINAVFNLFRIFLSRFPEAAWTVNLNQPVPLEPGFRPQPDLVVLVGPRTTYEVPGHRPPPADVAILVEVSYSSYAADSGEFLRRYARAGIRQYWIVNIRTRAIEVYTDPDAEMPGFRSRKDYDLDATLPLSMTIANVTSEFEGIPVRDVLRNSLAGA